MKIASLSPNLDLLRAVAVSSVFFAHLYETVTPSHSLASNRIGQLGVIIFFVHTSLVLMQALGRSKLTGPARVREFFIHRMFRIYPLSVVCVLIAFMLPGAGWSMADLAANLSLTMNLTYSPSMVGGLWTLPLEVQMYLVLPVLFLLLKDQPLERTLLAGFIALLLALLVPSITQRLTTIEYAPCFFGGILAWRISKTFVLPGWAFPLAIVGASLPWLTSQENTMLPRWISCVILGAAIPHFREIASEAANNITSKVAKYSYGIYLTHAAALSIAFDGLSGHPMFVQCVAFVGMAVAFPLAAFHLIEAPMIALGKRVARGSLEPRELRNTRLALKLAPETVEHLTLDASHRAKGTLQLVGAQDDRAQAVNLP